MNNIYILLLTSIMSGISTYIDKHLINIGITRKDYFYYMCLTMIPFSIVMIIITYFIGNIKFEFSIIPIILLICAMIMRYIKQLSVVGIIQKLDPFENLSYLSIGIIFAYIIDIIIKVRSFSIISLLAIIITLLGILMISDVKIKNKILQKDIFIKIIGELSLAYIAHFILKYWSNAIYILLLNLSLTLIFSKNYKLEYHKNNKRIIKWAFIQQIFGFAYIYFYNYLSSKSVTISSYVKPITLLLTLIFAFFFKEGRKPKFKDLISILLIVIGICLINIA